MSPNNLFFYRNVHKEKFENVLLKKQFSKTLVQFREKNMYKIRPKKLRKKVEIILIIERNICFAGCNKKRQKMKAN